MNPTITQVPYAGDAPSTYRRKPGRKKAVPGAAPGVRSEKNSAKFANDGSLASVEAQLHKLAMTCYARVAALGISMDFSDVLQEMHLSYVKAKAKWNPEGGALFTTYCQIVCQNNFNHTIKRMETDRTEMGMVSINALDMGEGGDGSNPLDVMMQAAAPQCDNPDARLIGAQNMQANLNKLSAGAKRLVGLLLQYEQKCVSPSPRLRDLARQAGLEGPELQRAKLEILNTFGVTWQ